MDANHFDVIIIGGGQSGLATAYYLRRTKLNYIILDDQPEPGGSWLHAWDSLKLFSPAEHSSLPGWLMPKSNEKYPDKDHVIDYLRQYESRYKFPIKRNTKVLSVKKSNDEFHLETDQGQFTSRCLVSATGTWSEPFIPDYPNRNEFKGKQTHSAHYKEPSIYKGQKVLIIGGGNSAAQILSEVSKTGQTTWVTLDEPTFLPDNIDGRYLFEFATEQYKAHLEGRTVKPVGTLGDIVMVDSVKEARERQVLQAKEPFKHFYNQGVIWNDGTKEEFDAVIWCTGFRPALNHLKNLNLIENNRVKTHLTQADKIPGLWLVGYGSWTGYASATLIGVGRTARKTAQEIANYLSE